MIFLIIKKKSKEKQLRVKKIKTIDWYLRKNLFKFFVSYKVN